MNGRDAGAQPLPARRRLPARRLFDDVLDEAGRLTRQHDGDPVQGVVRVAIAPAARSPASATA